MTKQRVIRGTTPQVVVNMDMSELDNKLDITQKIDEYAILALDYKAQEKAFKAATKDKKARLEALEAELAEHAKEKKETKLVGSKATLEFSGRDSRSILPTDLYVYFRNLGRSIDFFKFLKVQLTPLEEEFGKAILDASGLVNHDYNPYSSIKILPKLDS